MPRCWVCGEISEYRPMHYPCEVGVMRAQLKMAQKHLCKVKDIVEGKDTLGRTRTMQVKEVIRIAMKDLPSTEA